MIHHRAFAGEEDLTGKRETAAVTHGRKEEQTLILERKSPRHVLASDCTVKLVKFSQLVNSGQTGQTLVKFWSIL